MRNLKTSHAFRNWILFSHVVAFVAATPVSCFSQATAPEPPTEIDAATEQIFANIHDPLYEYLRDPKDHYFIVRIKSVSTLEGNYQNLIGKVYHCDLLFDVKNTVKKSTIDVEGEAGGRIGAGSNIPDYAAGDLMLIAAGEPNDHSKYKEGLYFWCGSAFIPIGIPGTLKIDPRDQPAIEEALTQMKAFSDAKAPFPLHDQAIALIRDHKSYYLWALGVWMLATEGKKENYDLIARCFDDEKTTLREGAWADCRLRAVDQGGSDYPLRELHDQFAEFVRRHAGIAPQREKY